MARPSKRALLEVVVRTLSARGWEVVMLSSSDEHPAKLEITRHGERHRVLLYIWSLTHGGASRSANEYRIQITSGVRAFAGEAGLQTVILGWSDEFGVFAGFDFERRGARLGSSPSIQISRATIEGALIRGIATQDKGHGELAVAVRPDALGSYLSRIGEVHAGDLSGVEVGSLSSEEVEDFFAAQAAAPFYSFGSHAERNQRRSVLDRLDALEREVQRLSPAPSNRGHNNPPELLPEGEIEVAKDLLDATATIRTELQKERPDTRQIAEKASRLQRIGRFLQGIATKTKDRLQEKVGEMIVGGLTLAAAASWGPLSEAVMRVVAELSRWFQLLF
ncbi:MAG: hypothetical protein WBA73_01660 [Devosia sp.]